jgi:hypothetical protein
MTGRSLHDALLRVLCDGRLRALLDGEVCPTGMPQSEWTVIRRLPRERLFRMARFLARHYYRERVVRLFRHSRRLVPYTGRDPLTRLNTPTATACLDEITVGTAESANRLLGFIEPYLLQSDESIVAAIPYWRDLVRYQVAMFRCDATGGSTPAGDVHPYRAPSTVMLDFDWDLPAILSQLREPSDAIPIGERIPTTLLIARSAYGDLTTIRCPEIIRTLVETSNGKRSVTELSALADRSVESIRPILFQLHRIGAIVWKAQDQSATVSPAISSPSVPDSRQ